MEVRSMEGEDTVPAKRRFINNFIKKGKETKSEKENLDEYKQKLEKDISEQEKRAEALSRQIIVDKLLNNYELETQELQDLLQMGKNLKLNRDRDLEKSSTRSLKELQTLTTSEVTKVTNKLRKVSPDGSTNSGWNVSIAPDKTNHPDVLIHMIMITSEKHGDMPNIQNFSATIDGIEIDSDAAEAVTFCKKYAEPQLLTRLVKEYLPLYAMRQEILDNVDANYCRLKSNNVLEFFNDNANILGHLCLVIRFRRKTNFGWDASWQVVLTDAGIQACRNLYVPEELITQGNISSWDWKQTVETLTKVSKFDVMESPSKGNQPIDEVDVSNIDTATPILHQKKISKRKLI